MEGSGSQSDTKSAAHAEQVASPLENLVVNVNRSRNNSLLSNNSGSGYSGGLLHHYNLSQFEADIDNRSDRSVRTNASNSNVSQKSFTSNVSDTVNVGLSLSSPRIPNEQSVASSNAYHHYNINNNSIANSVSSFISEAK
jgi:hypothetical protein